MTITDDENPYSIDEAPTSESENDGTGNAASSEQTPALDGASVESAAVPLIAPCPYGVTHFGTSPLVCQDELDLAVEELQEAVGTKQDQLVAGDNITIVDNVISATGGGSAGGIEFEQANALTHTAEVKYNGDVPYVHVTYPESEDISIAWTPAAGHGATLTSYPYGDPVTIDFDNEDVRWEIQGVEAQSSSAMGEPSDQFYRAGDFQMDVNWIRTFAEDSNERVVTGTVDIGIVQDYYSDGVSGLPNANEDDTIYSGGVKVPRSFIDAVLCEVTTPDEIDHALPSCIPLQEVPPSDLYEQSLKLTLQASLCGADGSSIVDGLLVASAGLAGARIERRLISTYNDQEVWKYFLIATYVIGPHSNSMESFYSTSTWTGSSVTSLNIIGLYPNDHMRIQLTGRAIAGPAQIEQ